MRTSQDCDALLLHRDAISVPSEWLRHAIGAVTECKGNAIALPKIYARAYI
jgi:hypothetical protein